MKKIILMVLIIFGFSFMLKSQNNIFVDKAFNGETSVGSIEQPFKTIQEAVNASDCGDNIYIKQGIYREEVRIGVNGISLQPYGNDTVRLNGCLPVLEWEPIGNSVYKAIMDWDVTEFDYTNQIFMDGEMLQLARWPKETSPDIISNPTWAIMDEVTKEGAVFTITDNEIPEPAGLWKDAQIFINPSNFELKHGHEGQGWTGMVSSLEGKTFTTASKLPKGGKFDWGVEEENYYYFFNPSPEAVYNNGGVASLLSGGEWWKNGDTLFVKTPDGNSPATNLNEPNLIEAKKYPFVIRPVKDGVLKNITIKGLFLFGSSITTDDNFKDRNSVSYAENVVIDGINAKYVMHSADLTGNIYWQWTTNSGIILSGTACVIKNCHLNWSASSAISAIGRNHKIINNIIENCNYMGTEAGAINFGSENVISEDMEVGYNTIFNTPHNGISYQGLVNSDINKPGVARIHHNHLYNTMTQYCDLGVIKGAGEYGGWMRIDHNLIHNDKTIDFGNARAGLYFDYGNSNRNDNSLFIVDHNVVYGIEEAILLNHLNGIQIFNNTLLGEHAGIAAGSMEGTGKDIIIQNNIYSSISDLPNAIISNNYEISESKLDEVFMNSSQGDYSLSENAVELINKGIDISPWNDVLTDEIPDIGAYEFGQPKWTVGAEIHGKQSPFNGTPAGIPGIIQAEDYDLGGKGVAYADSTTDNASSVYRYEGVDIENISGTTDEYMITSVKKGEWLEYTVEIQNSGIYTLEARIASISDGSIQISFSDLYSTGEIQYASTGDFDTWSNIQASGIYIKRGKYVMRVIFNDDNVNLDYIHVKEESITPKYKLTLNAINGNIATYPFGHIYDSATVVKLVAQPPGGYGFQDWNGNTDLSSDTLYVTITSDTTFNANFFLQEQEPFGGIPWPVPGVIQSENYDVGGNNISYYDNTEGNHYNLYRSDDIDIHELNCGGYGVGRMAADEWLEYTINIAKTDTYNILIGYAAPIGWGGVIEISFDKNNARTGSFNIPEGSTDEGGWRNCENVEYKGIVLEEGLQIMKIDVTGGYNMDYIKIYNPDEENNDFFITTSQKPSTGGNITIDPVKEKYENLTEVTVLASPVEGYKFVSWEGDVSGSANPVSFTVISDVNIVANFEKLKYTLTTHILPAESGNIYTEPEQEEYEYGTEVFVKISPDSSYLFENWTGDLEGENSETTIILDANKTITANLIRATGISSNKLTSVMVYPNPASRKLYVKGLGSVFYEIVDFAGVVIKKGVINHDINSYCELPISSLNSGIYFLKYQSVEKTGTVKFIKK